MSKKEAKRARRFARAKENKLKANTKAAATAAPNPAPVVVPVHELINCVTSVTSATPITSFASALVTDVQDYVSPTQARLYSMN